MVNKYRDNCLIYFNKYCFLKIYEDFYKTAIEFDPWTGQELERAFLWEVQYKISDILMKKLDSHILVKDYLLKYGAFTPNFKLPSEFEYLLKDKEWFYHDISIQRRLHVLIKNKNEYCGGLSVFIDCCYNMDESLPNIVYVPIKFCPFCGIKLPKIFLKTPWWVRGM